MIGNFLAETLNRQAGLELLNAASVLSAMIAKAVDEARRLELPDIISDIERAHAAAARLRKFLCKSRDFHSTGQPRQSATTATDQSAARRLHDLKSPLSAIIGYAGLVAEELEDHAGATSLIASINQTLKAATDLVGTLDSLWLGIPEETAHAGIVPFHGHDMAGSGLADVDHSQAMALSPAKVSAGTMDNATAAGRILVIDDDFDSRTVVRRRLVNQGHYIQEVQSGHEGLAALASSAFDLVLLDLVMPGMDGFEVLNRLKADPLLRDIPVIMLSGHSEIDSAIRCIAAGAEDYLSKPFNPVLLRARVNASLERKRRRDREREHFVELADEKAKVDGLLRAILPETVVARLKAGETIIADRYDSATVLFADLVGFTAFAAQTSAARVVEVLDGLFSAFDAICKQLGVEKIKTIGDAYMAAAGLPQPRPDHAGAVVRLGLGMIDAVEKINQAKGLDFQLRVGIHTGPVVAGVIGRDKFIYDVWGDTVNVAHRLEDAGMAGRIQVSDITRQALAGHFHFEPRRVLDLAGVGATDAYLLSWAQV